jgi:hypothetical protein
MHNRVNTGARQWARALGWFSLALGAAELIAPGSIKRQVGMIGPKAVLQAYGVREIGTGLAILASERPVSMVWGRVAGDLLDLVTAAPVLRPGNPRRVEGGGAFAFLLLATALDLAVALQGDEKPVPAPLRSGVRLNMRPADLADGAAPANRLPPAGASSGLAATAG